MNYFDHTDVYYSSSWLWNSNPVGQFESEFAEYTGIKHTIATSYGRTALYLGLRALDVNNMEVIIPAFICTVVRHAVLLSGAIPKFVDTSYETLEYDITELKNAISKKTGAILVTHLFGKVPHNFDAIISLANQHDIPIIEDCAHALGAYYRDKKVGTFGLFSIFSLTKNSINFGGGVFATNNTLLFTRAQQIVKQETCSLKKSIVDFPLLFSYGLEQFIEKALFDRVGKSIFKWWLIKLPRWIVQLRSFLISVFTFRFYSINTNSNNLENTAKDDRPTLRQYPFSLTMSKLTASLARNQLRKIDCLNDRRKKIVKNIIDNIACSFTFPVNPNAKSAYSFVVLKFDNNTLQEIITHCRTQGLLLRATWPTHQKLWDEQATPNVKQIGENILTWNVNPMLSNKEINTFVDIINSLPDSQDVGQSDKTTNYNITAETQRK